MSPMLGSTTSNKPVQHIIEAKIVVGDPVIVPNKPSGSIELANIVSRAFGHGGES